MAFNVCKYDLGRCFFAYANLPSGQTIKIEFEEDATKDKKYYNIHLVTMDKRKNAELTTLHTTGKDGLLGLLWAKQKVVEFEEFIVGDSPKTPIVIFCRWDDNRRRNAYYRGLRGIGYEYGMVFGKKAILKRFAATDAGNGE